MIKQQVIMYIEKKANPYRKVINKIFFPRDIINMPDYLLSTLVQQNITFF